MLHRASILVGIVLMTLASLMLSACGKDPFVGTWELDKEAIKAELAAEMKKSEGGEAEEGMQDFAAAMIMGMIDTMKMEVEIKSDHTFVGTTEMVDEDQKDTVTGTWAKEGAGIVMTVTGEQPGHATLKDGKLHLTMDGQADQPTMILKKK